MRRPEVNPLTLPLANVRTIMVGWDGYRSGEDVILDKATLYRNRWLPDEYAGQ